MLAVTVTFLILLAYGIMAITSSSLVVPVAMQSTGPTSNPFSSSTWRPQIEGTGPNATVVGQNLTVIIPPGSFNDPIRGAFGGALVSTCSLQGDFDIQVSFELQTWPQFNGVRVGLGSIFQQSGPGSLPANHYAVERDSFGAIGDFAYNQSYSTDLLDGPQGFVHANDLSGTLRIARNGGAATGYFLKNGTWTVIHSGPMTTSQVSVSVGAWSHDYAFSHQLVKVAIGQFILNAGDLSCPTIQASPTMGPPGTRVVLSGSNFPAEASSPSTVTVTFDNMFLGTMSDASGTFSFIFDVPLAQQGQHQINAVDSATGTNASTTFTVTALASSLSVSLSTGSVYFPGDKAVVTALVTSGGVPVGSSGLQLTLVLTQPDNSKIVLNITSLGSGLFKTSYSLSKSALLGTYTVVATAHLSGVPDGTSIVSFEVKLPWLSSQGQTAIVGGGIATVGAVGVALVSWRKGYFRKPKAGLV